MMALIACKVVHSPQVTGARSDGAATSLQCSMLCECMCVPVRVFVAMNLNILPIIPSRQGHFGMNPGIWYI